MKYRHILILLRHCAYRVVIWHDGYIEQARSNKVSYDDAVWC